MDDAEQYLQRVLAGMAGPGARPRPDQVEAVDALIAARQPVLLVQATGWGKSAVYWAATLARRSQGHGATLVVSPLLALMRDQVSAARRAGLRAATVNSSNIEEWDAVLAALAADELDVLLISPERLGNPRFEQRATPLLAGTGLLVIDEAHCISDWGFDFRPDYQRVAQLLTRISTRSAVLATTATANARVTADVATQLGQRTLVLRGPLARAGLRLSVIPGLDGVQRFAWAADALAQLPGSGIVYTLTVDQATTLTGFLAEQGFEVAAYTGQTEPAERDRIESELRENRLKAVVATSALGMGYDKPDLGFCLHLGSPDSPVAYYQQVGRAGRALQSAAGVLLPAAESDPRIWEYFATATVPRPDDARRVLALLDDLGDEGATVPAIEAETGLRRGRLEALLKILRVDGAVDRRGSAWVGTGQGWSYDEAKYTGIIAARRAEAALMREYATGARCLMQVLTEALDDPAAGSCGRCSVCTAELPSPGALPGGQRVVAARGYLRRRVQVLQPRQQWPRGTSRHGRIVGIAPGRAVAHADDPAWRELIDELDAADAPPGEQLRQALVDVLARWSRDWDARPVAVVPMPSRSHPVRVRGMAEHIAAVGRLPLLDVLRANGAGANVAGANGVDLSSAARVVQLQDSLHGADGRPLPDGPVLLIDDYLRTGWTVTVAAAVLRELGGGPVLPLVAHRRV